MKKITLEIVQEPPTASIATVKPQSGFKSPFFIGRGKGNIDYLCGKCHKTLAKAIWQDSIRSIVVQCYNCHSYNEFPSEPKSSFSNTIMLTTGTCYFSGPVYLDFGKVVAGNVLPTRKMTRSDIDSLLGRKND